jgi:tripartite-type tricarboxylate transporter receptor subunit TctC
MRKKIISAALSVAFAVGAALSSGVSFAQADYPNKPVRIVVGFSSGSSADVAARVIAQGLIREMGQQFVVENKPGASSNIATEGVARATPDGYTLLTGTIANTINASLYQKLPFDFGKDFAPIGLIGAVPNLLVVHPALGVNTVNELIALAKSKPGQIAYGSSGNGTSPHLSGELFSGVTGIKLIHVPYKGSSQVMVDLIAGRVSLMFSPASTALPHIKAGKLKALATTGLERSAVAPDLPTLSELGLKDFSTTVWFGLVAPAGTPPAIVERLAKAVAAARNSADVKAQFHSQGFDIASGGPKEFAEYIRTETEKWAQVIKTSGTTIN